MANIKISDLTTAKEITRGSYIPVVVDGQTKKIEFKQVEDNLHDTFEIGVTKDTVYANGADYAEIGEWYDLNPTAEDRLYRFVTLKTDGRKIAIANSTDQIVGITTTGAAFVGNASNYQSTDITKAIVGLLGVVSVKTNDSSIVANDRVMSDNNGYAVKSSNNCGYRVLRKINNNLLEIVVSPNSDMIQRIKSDMESKQDKLVAGTNITINGNTISAIGGGSGEENVIETIKVNGTNQTVTDKTVDISVPTKTSDLNNDSGFTANYNDLTDKPVFNAGDVALVTNVKCPLTIGRNYLFNSLTLDGTVDIIFYNAFVRTYSSGSYIYLSVLASNNLTSENYNRYALRQNQTTLEWTVDSKKIIPAGSVKTITVSSTDPGTDSTLAEGTLLLVYEE